MELKLGVFEEWAKTNRWLLLTPDSKSNRQYLTPTGNRVEVIVDLEAGVIRKVNKLHSES